MQTRILILDLRNDPELIARYEAWHAPGAVPLEVVRSIREAGITGMRIYRSGNRLVMLMDVDDSFDPAAKAAADAANPDVQAWEELMSTFQQALPWADASEKWVEAHSIFDLDQQG